MANKKEIPDWLKEEWKKRGYPPTGPTLREHNVDFSQLYESLSEYLEVPRKEANENCDSNMNKENQSKKLVEVVAAVIEFEGLVLCVKRGPAKYSYISEKWEFPGGKIEDKETPEDALAREILEELNLPITVKDHIITVDHEYPDFRLKMCTYRCSAEKIDDLKFNEHTDHRWLKTGSEEMANLDWAGADIPIVNVLGGK